MRDASTKKNHASRHDIATHDTTRYGRENAGYKGIAKMLIRRYVLKYAKHTYYIKRANLLFFRVTTKSFFTFSQLFVTSPVESAQNGSFGELIVIQKK